MGRNLKSDLLKLGKSGANRPAADTKLGRAIRNYCTPTSLSFDREFRQELRHTAPHWFRRSIRRRRKAALIELAKSGAPRPPQETPEGTWLSRYTVGKYPQPSFYKRLQELRPDWFPFLRVEKRVNEILDLARRKQPRPKGELSRWISVYTTRANAGYRPDLDLELRTIVPHWFRRGWLPPLVDAVEAEPKPALPLPYHEPDGSFSIY